MRRAVACVQLAVHHAAQHTAAAPHATFSSGRAAALPTCAGQPVNLVRLALPPRHHCRQEGGAQIGIVASLEAGAQLFPQAAGVAACWACCLQHAQRCMHDSRHMRAQPTLPVSTRATVVMRATATSPTSEMPDSLSRERTALEVTGPDDA